MIKRKNEKKKRKKRTYSSEIKKKIFPDRPGQQGTLSIPSVQKYSRNSRTQMQRFENKPRQTDI